MPISRRTHVPRTRSLHVTRRVRRSVAVGVSAAVALSLAPGLSGPAVGAKSAANLVVKSASVDRTTIAEGATLRITHTVRNAGTAKAAASETRFYLTTDVAASKAARKASRTNPRSAPLDVPLTGSSAVKALAGGRSQTVASKVTVPVGTAVGSYSVLACADDRGWVKEKSETDNCTVAAKSMKVKAAEGSDSLVLQQFADTYGWPADEAFNIKMMKVFCEMIYPPEKLTLKAALASATDALEEKVGAGALEKLDSSGQADTAVGAQEVAAAAVAGGAPGLALASLMRAHGLEPRNGTHLVNAAALATSVGLPNEALAFLDAAQALDVRRPAFGVSQHAIALTVRGQALTMTGRAAQAESMFLAAKAAEPLLSEADAGLAVLAACEGKDDIAAKYIRKNRQRKQKKDKTKPTEEQERPAPALDLGLGKVMEMRSFPMPETPAQGVVMHETYKEIDAALDAEMDANREEYWALQQHLRDTDELRLPAEINRRESIMMEAGELLDDPAIKALNDKATEKFYAVGELRANFFGESSDAPYTYGTLADEAYEACRDLGEGCWMEMMNATCRPALTAAHTQWRGLMGEMEAALGQHLAKYSRGATALASNLEDEEAHRLMLLTIEFREMSAYGMLVQQARFMTRYEVMYEDPCVAPLEAEVVEPGTAEPAGSSGPCPKHIAAMNWVALLGPTKIKVTCEKVTQEISAEVLPLIHAFGEMSYDFRTGKVTFFAGSKGEGKLGVVEAGFKSGIYLTSDGRGNVEDVGWRVGPSVSVVEGAAEFQAVEDMVDLSFVSGMRIGP